jgi:hypothetical protein
VHRTPVTASALVEDVRSCSFSRLLEAVPDTHGLEISSVLPPEDPIEQPAIRS